MLRFMSSFFSTLFVMTVATTVLFPPDTSPRARMVSGPEHHSSTLKEPGVLTNIELTHSFRLKTQHYEYTPPPNISQQHRFSLPHDPDAIRIWHGTTPGGFGPFPALILLHGSNRTGDAMIDMWRETARAQGIVLIAPHARNPQVWSLKNDGPQFLNALIKEAKSKYPIDPQQIYIMGHSAGGVFIQQLAGEDNPQWKAMASHGAATRLSSVRRSDTPVPLYLFTGSEDRLFPPENMKRAAEMLAAAGHDVTRFNIPGHTHWYYEIGPQLAPLIWQKLTQAN